MVKREEDEKTVGLGLVLLYPLISYEQEFFVEVNFPIENKRFKKEIEEKRKEAQELASETNSKVDFNAKRDCYEPNCEKFVFDLDVVKKDENGQIIVIKKKADQINEMEFKSQVYERIFKKMIERIRQD